MDAATKHVKTDPVCGMNVPDTSVYRTTRNGETYFFCSDHCRQTFVSHPSEYLIPGLHTRERAMPAERNGSAKTPEPAVASGDMSTARTDWSAYTPLFVLVDVCLVAATVQEWVSPRGWHGMDWMNLFMGWFMTLFATLKLFDLSAFADGFQRYDLLAKQVRGYALIYPFIELILGLGYLARVELTWVATATVAVMLFGALGVVKSLIRGEKLNCACMGKVLNVPLSRVALLEDLSMAAMAAAMLIWAR